MGIERQWKKRPLLETLNISDDEWVAAENALNEQMKKGYKPPFKIDRKKIKTEHSFIAVLDEDSGEPKLAAMARGKYISEGILGHGAFGVVKLIQWQDGHCDAVKIESNDNDADSEEAILKRVGQHVGKLSRVRENLTKWIDGKNIKDKKYTLLKQIKGNDMSDFLVSVDFFTVTQKERVTIAIAAAKAIATVHRNNVIHCDVKPANFKIQLPDRNSDKPLEMVAVTAVDFGLSMVLKDNQKTIKTNKAVGSPLYIPPEVATFDTNSGLASFRGKYTKKVDVYALGVMFKLDLAIYEGPYKALIDDMTQENYKKRPSAEKVAIFLNNIHMYHSIRGVTAYENKQKNKVKNSSWKNGLWGMSSAAQLDMAKKMQDVMIECAASTDHNLTADKVLAILKDNQNRHKKTLCARASRFNLKTIQDLPKPVQAEVCSKLGIPSNHDLLFEMSMSKRKELSGLLNNYEIPVQQVQEQSLRQ